MPARKEPDTRFKEETMKRDMELVVRIWESIEKRHNGKTPILFQGKLPDYDIALAAEIGPSEGEFGVMKE